jgi:hypothetical protein
MTADKGARLGRFGEPNTVTIDVADGIAKSGSALRLERILRFGCLRLSLHRCGYCVKGKCP